MQTLCDALVAATFDRLNLLPPDSLAALVTGFGALGHTPGTEWMGRFCLESFARCVCGGGGEGGDSRGDGCISVQGRLMLVCLISNCSYA